MNNAVAGRLLQGLWEPVRAMKAAYVPFLAVYFAFGLTGITSIATMFWTKDVLQFTPAQLALAGFWAGVPWTLKMLFGQFVDVRPILGSPRCAYIFIGAGLVALGYVANAGLAGDWEFITNLASPVTIFFLAGVMIAAGLVIQDVTADAMTSEMNTGDEHDARSIQVLGRIAIASGGIVAAFFAGTVAQIFSYETVFLLACGIPAISVLGAIFWKQKEVIRSDWNYPILFGGFGFALFVILVSASGVPGSAEIVFTGNVVAVAAFLYFLGRTLDRNEALALLATGAAVFVFRAMPSAGAGVTWWQVEVLGFDREFLGRLQLIGGVFGLVGLVLAARSLRNYSISVVLSFVTIVGTILTLPVIGMYFGLHLWTEEHLGFGARSIALIDTAIASPFGHIAMVPMLALIAMVSRRGNPATWFALSASFMNLPLATAELLTKWLNQTWTVTQTRYDATGAVLAAGDFSNLGMLLIITTAMGLIIPLFVLRALRGYLEPTAPLSKVPS